MALLSATGKCAAWPRITARFWVSRHRHIAERSIPARPRRLNCQRVKGNGDSGASAGENSRAKRIGGGLPPGSRPNGIPIHIPPHARPHLQVPHQNPGAVREAVDRQHGRITQAYALRPRGMPPIRVMDVDSAVVGAVTAPAAWLTLSVVGMARMPRRYPWRGHDPKAASCRSLNPSRRQARAILGQGDRPPRICARATSRPSAWGTPLPCDLRRARDFPGGGIGRGARYIPPDSAFGVMRWTTMSWRPGTWAAT